MIFRKVTAIFRSDRLEAVEERLRSLRVPGISVTKVKGFGEYANFYQPDRLCSHVRIEVFTSKLKADKVAEAIIDTAHTGLEGDGIVAVLPVESVYHIRTKEKCQYDACE
jgi:nitrogen regulatory protein P-II 1